MTLQVLQKFYPHPAAKVCINLFFNTEFRCQEKKVGFDADAKYRRYWSYKTHNVRLYT